MPFFYSEASADEDLDAAMRRPRWTTRCTGDLGIITAGRIVAHAFVHGEPPKELSLHVYDLILGGPATILPLAKGLHYMEELALSAEQRQDQSEDPSRCP